MATPAAPDRDRPHPRGERPLPRRGGGDLRLEVGDRLRRDRRAARCSASCARRSGEPPGHYARALEIGAGTGYFTLNLLRAGVVEQAVATDISPGMLRRAVARPRAASASTSRRCEADAEALPFADESFDLVHRARRAAPPSRSRHARCRSSAACSRRAARSRSWASRRVTATASRSCRSGSAAWSSRRGGASMSAAPKANGSHPVPPAGVDVRRARGGSWTCTRSRPTSCARSRTGAGLVDVRVCGEELLANMYGWFLRRLESDVDARRPCPAPGTSSRFAATSRCRASTAACWSRGCRRTSSTT